MPVNSDDCALVYSYMNKQQQRRIYKLMDLVHVTVKTPMLSLTLSGSS